MRRLTLNFNPVNGLFQRLSNARKKIVNIGAMSWERGAYTQCEKIYEILMLVMLISIFTRKSNAQLGRSHFGSNFPL